MHPLLDESAVGGRELEGPEEVGGLLESGAHRVDLVDQVLHADQAGFAESVLDNVVLREGHTLTVDLAEATLVDHLADSFEVGVSPGDVGLDALDQTEGSLVNAD